jgi:phosphate/sulfate permease
MGAGVLCIAAVTSQFDQACQDESMFLLTAGMLPIFLSWIVSPVMCAIITVILFFFIRMFILRSPHGFMRAFYVSICWRHTRVRHCVYQ